MKKKEEEETELYDKMIRDSQEACMNHNRSIDTMAEILESHGYITKEELKKIKSSWNISEKKEGNK